MLKNRTLLGKTVGYKILTAVIYCGVLGAELGISIAVIGTVAYFAYDWLFSRVFSISQRHRGLVVWMTGLPCSGKTTISKEVEAKLIRQGYKVERLDGDTLRTGICEDLGFSQEDRTENQRRVGHIANILQRQGTIVLCALISPYEADRQRVLELCGADTMLVFVDAPKLACATRDVKGMWAQAYSGKIKNFTGVDDPYEIPASPDLHIRTGIRSIEECSLLLEKKIISVV